MRDVLLAVFGVAALLGLVSLLLPLARRLDVPFTVLLAIFGVALGLGISVDWGVNDGVLYDFLMALRLFDLSSDAFIYVFLPPLLFAAGLGVRVRRLMDDVWPVIVLAVVAVVVCTGIVGLVLQVVAPQYGLVACLLLGSIVATTDSAAVVAIFRDIGAPARLSIIVEGESLFNDAAAIALFVVLLALVTGTAEPSTGTLVSTFIFGLVGGVAVGFVLAKIFVVVLGLLRDAPLTEITLTLSLAYLVFICSEAYLGVSGVIAVVTAAMVIGSEAHMHVTPRTWGTMSDTWALVEFIATSLIFTLAAMMAPAALAGFTLVDFSIVLTIFLAAIAARVLVLYGLMPALSLVNLSQPISGSYKAVLVWGGLRGAVTVALALAVAENPAVPEEIQRFVLVSATGFVFLTLVVMAPTIRPLMGAFGIEALSARDRVLRDRVRQLTHGRARHRVRQIADHIGLNGEDRPSFASMADLTSSSLSEADRQHFGFVVLAGRERELYLDYLHTGIVDRRIADMLRTQTGRVMDAIKTGGGGRYLDCAIEQISIDARFRRALWLHNRMGLVGPLSRSISDRFELLIIMQMALKDLSDFVQDHMMPLIGVDAARALKEALVQRESVVSGNLELLDLQYPSYAAMLRARYVERVALGFEGAEYRQHRDQAVISNEVFEDLEHERRNRAKGLGRRPTLDLGLRLASMLQNVPLLAEVDEDSLSRISKVLTPRLAVPGETIITKGDIGESMFFIVTGAVEVVLPDTTVRLSSGEFFGEMAILTEAPRTADVVAAGYCTLLSLSGRDFQRLLRANPALKSRIERTAAARKLELADAQARTSEDDDPA